MRSYIRNRAGSTVAALVLASLAGCDTGTSPTGPSSASTPSGGAREVELPASAVQTVANGLRIPWGIAFLPDGTALVTERGNDLWDGRERRDGPAASAPPTFGPFDRGTARILSVTSAGQVTEVLRLAPVRANGDGGVWMWRGEGGLLGVAVSPHYATDGWIYIYYTSDRDNRIARFRLGEQPQPIFTGIPAGETHNGGRLAFGPDGMLYATTGETGVTRHIAQDPNSLGGKILRITPDGRPAPGNPFPDSAVWSLGHRNPQGLAWDSTGRMYAAELGQDTFDELNRIEPGRNYGWPIMEGMGDDPRFTNPIVTWRPIDASPSGIAIVADRVYIACLRGQRLYRIGLDGRDAEALLVRQYGRLRAVAPAPDGSLWLLTSNRDGLATTFRPPASIAADDDRILRLTP